ncbi:homoserine dehydrogenase [Persicirhabdus sediminis]|uniref:Homoserine dehydrogenase n=1 Tax=Persicirhabdus sediminis TaxID=454144 RepID=A0A8J7MEJ0_9BACT|nr:homoserine dehydrogenase [Persicirhabdus sediminis]MBK1792474.1 homoserine dehydrogenase [Persicirhabdus sediminis]
MKKALGIGLAGFGTVGSGVWETLEKNSELIQARTGVQVSINRIAVRDLTKAREGAAAELFTTDWQEVVNDDSVQMVVELIGGTTTAFDIVSSALKLGKPVVTGNKALLAERGAELFELSRQHNAPILFEAAIAGAIPIVKAIKDSFAGNRIESMAGIINGTSNYILERMTDAGLDYKVALAEAQELGYAEADPTLDVNGWDAAHKAILLTSLAHGFVIDPADVYVDGIEQVRGTDIAFAKNLGYVVKLLCVMHTRPDGAVELRTQASFISQKHILSSVNGVFNAVAVTGDAAGESLFYGRGAGKGPTASSVVGDIIELAQAMGQGSQPAGFLPYKPDGGLLPIEETETPYYVRFDVSDRPGVVADIAQVLAQHGIGISGTHSPVNSDDPDAEFVDMVFMLHTCPWGKLQATLSEVEKLDCINSAPVVFRIEAL